MTICPVGEKTHPWDHKDPEHDEFDHYEAPVTLERVQHSEESQRKGGFPASRPSTDSHLAMKHSVFTWNVLFQHKYVFV